MNRKERRAANKRRDEAARRPGALGFAMASISVAELAVEAGRLHGAGRTDEARLICRQILAREPGHVQSLNLLGLMAQTSGDHGVAVKMFAKAITADEANPACHYNAGNSYKAMGNRSRAMAHFSKALALGMEDRAVTFVLQSRVVGTYISRIARKWPLPMTRAELFGTESLAPLADDLFLRCTMEATTLPDVQLEALLGYARAELLRLSIEENDAGDDMIGFACALARQCFINEYIFAQGEAEGELASRQRDRLLQDLASGAAIKPLALAVVAAYFPLHALPAAEALLRRDWPASVSGLLRVQLREPLEEAADRGAIAKLGRIDDSTSKEVMAQYEQNPYPRWIINPLNAFVADQARGMGMPTAEGRAELDILIAGCGTGLHAVQIAQLYPQSHVLAVDISLTSLAYARRKTRELGLRNIEYAQADILELGSIGRTFDRIESVGVLHHLAEPTVGWRVLVSLLRPGGQMRIGLYSDLGRRVIAEARDRIVAPGYRATPEDIARCRQDIVREAEKWRILIGSRDFYSMSGCRDLLFNVMEHRLTIPEIAAFLKENGLTFQSFEPFDDPMVIEKFHREFSGAADDANLDQWHRFEADHPETFWGMYVFTVTKNV